MRENSGRERERQQEQEGHRGWTRGMDSQGPKGRADGWQHFDTKKARSTQLLYETQAAARGLAGREREGERTEREVY